MPCFAQQNRGDSRSTATPYLGYKLHRRDAQSHIPHALSLLLATTPPTMQSSQPSSPACLHTLSQHRNAELSRRQKAVRTRLATLVAFARGVHSPAGSVEAVMTGRRRNTLSDLDRRHADGAVCVVEGGASLFGDHLWCCPIDVLQSVGA